MSNFNQAYQVSVELVTSIISNLGLADETGEIKNNLLFSIYLQFINQAADATQNKALIDKLSTVKNPISFEDFSRVVEEGKTYLQAHESDQVEILKNATSKILQDYLTQLESKLPPQKVTELKQLIMSGLARLAQTLPSDGVSL